MADELPGNDKRSGESKRFGKIIEHPRSRGITLLTSVYECTYNEEVEYEWDPKKATSNRNKHGVDFADAALALEDDRCHTIRDDMFPSEDRFVTLGIDSTGRCLVVVFTHRAETIRIISARPASKRERRFYNSRR